MKSYIWRLPATGTGTDDDELLICGDCICTGIKVSAEDPLGQYICPYHNPHTRKEGQGFFQFCPPDCYDSRVLDCYIAAEVKKMYPSKGYDQMWGLTDDPEEWTEEV
jgi:hypothetical protein